VEKATYDLIIAGGGPAGSSAAITAARSGARVLLLERGHFPRHKVCGEFVSPESLDLLAGLLGPGPSKLLRGAVAIRRARLFLDGRELETTIEPPAASIARFDLDAALWDSAVSAGVDARQRTTVQGIADASLFRVTTSSGEFEARAVLNASGRWSNLSPAGNGRQRERWVGLKAHFSRDFHGPSVDLYFFDGGYCGVQPVEMGTAHFPGQVNVCAMVRAEVGSTLPEVFARHCELWKRSRCWQPLSKPVSTSPLIFCEPQAERDRILQAGDASGFVDPFVGDGISLALRSGTLAGHSLTPFFQGEISLDQAVESYRWNYAQRLAPVFRASSKIRRMLILPRALRSPLLFLLENTPALTQYLMSKTR
jgi:flavin-dependent dehydrogenase